MRRKAGKVVFLFFASFLILTVGVSCAKAFSGGGAFSVDEMSSSSELPVTGKGIWIWKIYDTDDDGKIDSGNLPSVIEKTKSAGIRWVVIKFGDGSDYWPTNPERKLYKWFKKNNYTLSDIINGFHNAGIKIFGWHYVYGDDPTEEADVSNKILNISGIDGLIIDVEPWEKHWGGNPEGEEEKLELIRDEHPHDFIAYTTYARSGGDIDDYYKVYSRYCDAVMPQAYWAARPLTPEKEIEKMEEAWGSVYDKWEGIPIIPVGQGGYLSDIGGRDIYNGEISRFCNKLQDSGYEGVSIYRYGIMDEAAWDEYASSWEEELPASPVTSIIKETGSHDIDLHKFSFTQDTSGNLHVVFVEKIDDNKGILYYARSTDRSITWQIEELTTEHMPEHAILAVDKNGKAYIAYNDVDYSIPGCHKRDLYAYTNVEGSWKRTLIKEAWNYWGGGEYGYVQYYIPMDIIVDKDNIAHLYARQQGWWAYGGDIWEYTYRNGSWNGPVDTGVGGGVDVDGSNSESFHVNIKKNGDYYAVWADGRRYEGGYWSVNYTYIVQPYLFYGNRSSSSFTGPFSHTQVKSDAVWGVISTLDSENNVYALYNKWPLGTSYEDYAIRYRSQGEGPHQFLTTIAFTKNWGNSTEIASMPEWHQLQPRGVVVTKDDAVFILWSHYDYNSSKWNASYYSYQEANGTWHTPIFAGSGISAAVRKNYFATPSTFMYVYVDSHNTSDQKLVFVKYRSTKVLSLKTDKTNYSLGDVVRLEIKLNYTKDRSPVYAKFKLELVEPVGEPDFLFQTSLFPLLPGFNVTKTLKFKIPQTFWIPDGEYAFKATLTDSLGREIDSDVARFYVNDTLKVQEFDAV